MLFCICYTEPVVIRLLYHFVCVIVFSFRMPVKITKDAFGVTADGKQIAR